MSEDQIVGYIRIFSGSPPTEPDLAPNMLVQRALTQAEMTELRGCHDWPILHNYPPVP
jgi:hypothetical protein